MKARHIMLFALVMATVFLTGFPNSTHRALRADDPPPGITCGVWFPYVTDEVNYDTGISIAGDSSYLIAPLHIYFYDLAGNWQGETSVNIGPGQNTQWMATVSQLKPNFTGSMLITTYMSDVRAAAIIMDNGGTGAMASAPAIVDYSITGVNASHLIMRDTDEGLQYLDNIHTTLVFPHVTNKQGLNTAIVVSNPSNPPPAIASIRLYLYDTQGVLRETANVNANPNGCYCGLLSDIFGLSDIEGSVVAYMDTPYGQGCEFFLVPNAGLGSGIPAVVDNDIYHVDHNTGELHRAGTADVHSHTAIIIPYVTTSAVRQEVTYVTLANTAGVLDGVGSPMNNTAHFYLYGLDGNIKTVNGNTCSWTVSLPSDCQMATIWLTPGEIAVNGEHQTGYGGGPGEEGLGEFLGWMLITLDAPCGAYAVAHVGNSNFNQFDSYIGAIDQHITGVDMSSGNEGAILRANPEPPGCGGGAQDVPFFAATSDFDTILVTINARNKTDFGYGELDYNYCGYYATGDPVNYTTSMGTITGGAGVVPGSAVILSGVGFSGIGTLSVSARGYPIGVTQLVKANNGDVVFVASLWGAVNGKIVNKTTQDMIISSSTDEDHDMKAQSNRPGFVWIILRPGQSSGDDRYVDDADCLVLEAGGYKYGMHFVDFWGRFTTHIGGGVARCPDTNTLTLKGTHPEGADQIIDYNDAGGFTYYEGYGDHWKPTLDKLQAQLAWAIAVMASGNLKTGEAWFKFQQLKGSAEQMIERGWYCPP